MSGSQTFGFSNDETRCGEKHQWRSGHDVPKRSRKASQSRLTDWGSHTDGLTGFWLSLGLRTSKPETRRTLRYKLDVELERRGIPHHRLKVIVWT